MCILQMVVWETSRVINLGNLLCRKQSMDTIFSGDTPLGVFFPS